MSRQYFPAVVIAAIAFGTPGFSAAQTPSPLAKETDLDKLAAVLRSGAPHADKLQACKQLARLGTKDSVAALAPLLGDRQLSHPARLALEAICDPTAGAALREAAGRLKGLQLVGVIGSLGVRRDPEAVPLFERLAAGPEAEVASAAADGLGRIANSAAAAALERTLATAPPTTRNAVADACLECAERLRAGGQPDRALALFRQVAKADLPSRVRAAAMRGLILGGTRPDTAALAQQLQSSDKELFAMTLVLARELPQAEITQALVAGLVKLDPARRALVIEALGDRADVAARPAVVAAAASEEPAVRLAALRALATLGDAGAVPLLLAAASQADREAAEAAIDTLTVVPGIDGAIAEALPRAEGKLRLVLFELAGRRNIAAAAPILLKATESPDAATRLAAIAALGGIVAPRDFPSLTRRLSATGSAAEQAAAKTALKLACARRPDKQACEEALIACLPGASTEASCLLLELLGAVGGPASLKAVAAASLDPREEIQDTATRILGDWRTPDAAAALVEVVRKSSNPKFRLRALRGYLRVARQMDLSVGQRMNICREALVLAQRDEERVLALEALSRCAAPEALALVVPYLKSTTLKAAASATAVSIGEKIVTSHPKQVQAAMGEVLKATNDSSLVRRAKDAMEGKQAWSRGTDR